MKHAVRFADAFGPVVLCLVVVLGVALGVSSGLHAAFGPCPDEPPGWFEGAPVIPVSVLLSLRGL